MAIRPCGSVELFLPQIKGSLSVCREGGCAWDCFVPRVIILEAVLTCSLATTGDEFSMGLICRAGGRQSRRRKLVQVLAP